LKSLTCHMVQIETKKKWPKKMGWTGPLNPKGGSARSPEESAIAASL